MTDIRPEREADTAVSPNTGDQVRRRGRPAILDRDKIAQAGMRVAARDGFPKVNALTVANEMQVSKVALYRHISGAEDLRWLTANAISSQVSVDISTCSGWEEVLYRVMKAGRECVRAFPGLEAFFALPIPSNTAEARYPLVEMVFAALYEAGFDDAGAVAAYVTVSSIYSVGLDEAQTTTAHKLFSEFPPSPDTPAAARAAPHLQRISGDDLFEAVAEIVIAGLRSKLASAVPKAR